MINEVICIASVEEGRSSILFFFFQSYYASHFASKERNEVSSRNTTTMYYFTLILCMYDVRGESTMERGSRSKVLKIEEDSFCCLTYCCCYLGCNFFFKAIRAWNLWRL